MEDFGTFDLETIGLGGKFLNGGCFDGSKYSYYENLDDLVYFLVHSSIKIWYAHNGGRYDVRYLFSYLISNGYTIKPLIITSSIAQFNIYLGTKKICELRDSYLLLRGSLFALTTSFNVKHKKKTDTIDYNNMKISEQEKEYLKYDVIGLYEVIIKFKKILNQRNISSKLTISSCAMCDYKTNYPVLFSLIKNIDNKELRSGYYGGRVEIFKPFFKSCTKKLFCYDINSLYSQVMHHYKFPIGNYFISKKPVTIEYISLIEYDCPNDLNIPLLPIHHKGKLKFCTGYGKGIYSRYEIEKAIKLGYKIKFLKTYNFKNSEFLFKEYIDFWYNIKKKSKGAKRCISKLMLNSLYGKFGTRPDRQKYIINPNKKWIDDNFKNWSLNDFGSFEIWKKDYFFRMPYVNIPLVIYITSLARLILYNYIEKCEDVYYCDTDSIFTTTKLEVSNELGAMKLEKVIDEAYFLRPKVYACKFKDKDKDKELIKAKGFQKELLTFNGFKKAFLRNNYKDFEQNNKGIGGFKTTIKRFSEFICSYDMKKSIKSEYDKRILNLNTNSSNPYNLTKDIFLK
jgi:hypothetical protein